MDECVADQFADCRCGPCRNVAYSAVWCGRISVGLDRDTHARASASMRGIGPSKRQLSSARVSLRSGAAARTACSPVPGRYCCGSRALRALEATLWPEEQAGRSLDSTRLNGPTLQIPGSQNARAPIPTLTEDPEWMRLSTVCPVPAGSVPAPVILLIKVRTRVDPFS